jgi:hypothetical protein
MTPGYAPVKDGTQLRAPRLPQNVTATHADASSTIAARHFEHAAGTVSPTLRRSRVPNPKSCGVATTSSIDEAFGPKKKFDDRVHGSVFVPELLRVSARAHCL